MGDDAGRPWSDGNGAAPPPPGNLSVVEGLQRGGDDSAAGRVAGRDGGRRGPGPPDGGASDGADGGTPLKVRWPRKKVKDLGGRQRHKETRGSRCQRKSIEAARRPGGEGWRASGAQGFRTPGFRKRDDGEREETPRSSFFFSPNLPATTPVLASEKEDRRGAQARRRPYNSFRKQRQRRDVRKLGKGEAAVVEREAASKRIQVKERRNALALPTLPFGGGGGDLGRRRKKKGERFAAPVERARALGSLTSRVALAPSHF
ncbi:hypothetical protein HPB50_004312 [Hyalomma asiaticum]|uniref:Uncharacterized protein n=1 Tax=Hyalomma asiaticum TaxID=266040 RepID=A0ACB7RIW5_HYAAI|nr:hypothetical protein HPB50_004312 [Hyalomma asiaticum]